MGDYRNKTYPVARWREQYEAGSSALDIALDHIRTTKQYVSQATVANKLKAAGVEMRHASSVNRSGGHRYVRK